MDLYLVRSVYGTEIKLHRPWKLMPPPRLFRCAIKIPFLQGEITVVKTVLEGLLRCSSAYMLEVMTLDLRIPCAYTSKVSGTL